MRCCRAALLLLAPLSGVPGACPPAWAQTSPAQGPAASGAAARARVPARRIRLYLFRPGAESPTNPLGLAPVRRRLPAISSSSPARAALVCLLAGPTGRERRQEYQPVEGAGLTLRSIRIARGVARVAFSSRPGRHWRGDLSAPRFRAAVTRTLLQFPSVHRVQILLDGDPHFDSLKG